jgi:hypothetical protein
VSYQWHENNIEQYHFVVNVFVAYAFESLDIANVPMNQMLVRKKPFVENVFLKIG